MDEEILRQKEIQETIIQLGPEHVEIINWEGAQGEELLQKKRVLNESILEFRDIYDEDAIRRMGAQAQRVQVSSAAPLDQPLAEQPVAKESYKARRERQKKIKAAKKICPVGDENTLEMAANIKASMECRQAVYDDGIAELVRQNEIDTRTMGCFCQGYNLDKKGRPASEDDRAIQEINRSFMRDYASGDPLLRRPHLDRIKTQMIRWSFDMKPDMFTPENLVRRADEYRIIGDRFTYFENMKRENPEYFAQLPQVEREILNAQAAIGVAFVAAYSAHMNARGINFNNGTIYGHGDMTPIALGTEMLGITTENYSESLKAYSRSIKDAALSEIDRLMAAKPAHEYGLPGYTEELIQKHKIFFPGGGSSYLYQAASEFRDLIHDNPEAYQREKEVIDNVHADLLNSLSMLSELYSSNNNMSDIVNEYENSSSTDPIIKEIAKQASALLEEAQNQYTIAMRYAQVLMDLMHHLLTGSPLGDVAAPVLQRFRASTSEEE